jgi:beta-lactam-binding protein with PASTA domain
VPNVLQLKLPDAIKALVRSHCGAKVQKKYSSIVGKNRVISQRPRAGTVLVKGARVTLLVSRGARKAHKPRYTG